MGDMTRMSGPPFQNRESAYFLCVNRNKRSITTLKTTAEGLPLFDKHQVAKNDNITHTWVLEKHLAAWRMYY
jgi:crotonobetainyl-CoA:carnitine CoA-transferase CaiB-like acyl-CoA transferase